MVNCSFLGLANCFVDILRSYFQVLAVRVLHGILLEHHLIVNLLLLTSLSKNQVALNKNTTRLVFIVICLTLPCSLFIICLVCLVFSVVFQCLLIRNRSFCDGLFFWNLVFDGSIVSMSVSYFQVVAVVLHGIFLEHHLIMNLLLLTSLSKNQVALHENTTGLVFIVKCLTLPCSLFFICFVCLIFSVVY